tara:strand:- start:2152 stop:2679 length:528 start_codon:yes stop_codon:yes gene_type:complete
MSTLYVDSIQPKTTGQAITVATTNQSLGKLLQVVQGSKITGDALTSTSFATTGLSVNITPTSTSSKILITANWFAGYPTQNYGMILTLYRNSINLDLNSARTGFAHIGDSSGGGQRTYQGLSMSCQFLDSPNTTSETTYGLYYKMDGGTGYFNRNRQGDAASQATCIIIAQEIGG